ncbi:MAG: glycosyltransferase family 4 protein [Bacillota bacterium]
MRVAMLHWAFPPMIGGVETHLVLLGPELVNRGCQVHLLTAAVDGQVETLRWGGMRIIRHPLMDLNRLTLERMAALADQIHHTIREFIEKTVPDIIHVHNMHYFSPVHLEALVDIARGKGLPLVLTAHNVWEDNLWREMLAFRDAWDGIIAVSHFIGRELVRWGYPGPRIQVIHHGIDAVKFSPGNERDRTVALRRYPALANRRVIFHPARMSLAKGSDCAVKALATITREFPDVLLVLAGTEKTVDWGSYQQREIAYIRQLVAQLGLEGNVYIRFLPWDRIPDVYRLADVVIYPSSFEEPFGLVMLEAMATGKPIVVTEAGGMPEVVCDGVTGFIIPKRDVPALAARCLELLRNPGLARRMGERGREEVMARYTKERMTSLTIDFYRRVIGQARFEVASSG